MKAGTTGRPRCLVQLALACRQKVWTMVLKPFWVLTNTSMCNFLPGVAAANRLPPVTCRLTCPTLV